MAIQKEENRRELKELAVVLISASIGSMLSLYINNKYGANILKALNPTIIGDILFMAFAYFLVFAIATLLLFWAVGAINFIIGAYTEPLEKIYEYFKRKLPQTKLKSELVKILAPLKNIFLRKILSLALLTVFIVSISNWIVSHFGILILIILYLYSIAGMIFFIMKLIRK